MCTNVYQMGSRWIPVHVMYYNIIDFFLPSNGFPYLHARARGAERRSAADPTAPRGATTRAAGAGAAAAAQEPSIFVPCTPFSP